MADIEPNLCSDVALEQAIAVLDPVVALLSLVQITGDRRLLRKYGPSVEGARQTHVNSFSTVNTLDAPEADAAARADAAMSDEVRKLLLKALQREREPVLPTPDRALFREMARMAMGVELPEISVDPAMQHAGFVTDTRIRAAETLPDENFKVLVVGAGLVGINAAVKLQQAGFSYQVIEAEHDVGGVWLLNTYPGAATDTESRIYSYSFDPNSSWSRFYPTGPEFLTYLHRVVDKYALREHIDFNTRVGGAQWNEETQTWIVKAKRDGQDVTYEGNVLLLASGPLTGPKYPDIKNMDAFSGKIVHTATWDNDLDLTGKRVVLVGSACSGVQVASSIADKVGDLAIVMRQPEWLLPNTYASDLVDPREILAMENIPFVAQWKRLQTLASQLSDMRGMAMIDPEHQQKTGGVSPLNDGMREMCRNYIKQNFPDDPKMVEMLTPDYPMFAKRPILDCGYYATLKKPHVHLVKGALESFDKDAVILNDGTRIEADVVLLATGYNLYWGTNFDITGRDGQTIREIFDPAPFTYWGMLVPGLPNFAMPAGPHSHLTANHAIVGEQQIHYMIELLQTMVDEGLASFDVTKDAAHAFRDDVYKRLENTTWVNNGTAHGYYRHQSGKVVIALPRHNSEVWHELRQPKLEDFNLTPKKDAAPPAKPEMAMLHI